MAVKAHVTSALLLFLLLGYTSTALSEEDPDCVYTVYVRTGSIPKGGTDSLISLSLYDYEGGHVEIADVESWGGLMGPAHNYFERGNLDVFSGRAPCLAGPPCALALSSDGSGPHHGWYCNYVEVTATDVHAPCSQRLFIVEQWLALDTPPYELSAVRDYCSSDGARSGVVAAQ